AAGARNPLGHQVEGGFAVPDRLTEVTAQRAAEEPPVLHEEGIVEAHRLAEAPAVLRAGVGGQQHQGGISSEMQDEEDHEGYAEQHDQRLEQSPCEVGRHARLRRATASMCGVWGNMSTGCTHSS